MLCCIQSLTEQLDCFRVEGGKAADPYPRHPTWLGKSLLGEGATYGAILTAHRKHIAGQPDWTLW